MLVMEIAREYPPLGPKMPGVFPSISFTASIGLMSVSVGPCINVSMCQCAREESRSEIGHLRVVSIMPTPLNRHIATPAPHTAALYMIGPAWP